MDLKEAARKLNISETTARRWIKAGRLQARIIEGPYGPQYEIDQEAVEAAKNTNKIPVVISGSVSTLSQETLINAIQAAVREVAVSELEKVKNELEEIKRQVANTGEKIANWQEERDRKLMEVVREIQHRQEEMNKPFWKRWFKRK